MKMMYIGKGSFIPDVPARDLTKEEAVFFGVERLLASGLYIPAVKIETPKKSTRLETAQRAEGE
jgi:hypothetical protein